MSNNHYSLNEELQLEIEALSGDVPLGWVSSHAGFPLANFGDALSPVVISAISHLSCVKRAFNSAKIRIVSTGTIGHEQHNGSVHFWGSGVDPRRNIVDSSKKSYLRPKDTKFLAYAMRGPYSKAALTNSGIPVPAIYGDPGWFLPKIFKDATPKTHELGVIVHISELESPSTEAVVEKSLLRYQISNADKVKIISTYHDPSFEGFTSKLNDILSCKRIISTSFHGLIIPDAYEIPCLYFPMGSDGFRVLSIEDDYEMIDHRVADFYAGVGARIIPAYFQPPDVLTDWDYVMRMIDNIWEPTAYSGADFFDAFPLRKMVGIEQADWSLPSNLVERIIW